MTTAIRAAGRKNCRGGRDGRTARSAHLNSLEAFPLFAAGVAFAQMAGVGQQLIDALAGLFVFARLIYLWLYLNDRATARSLVWLVGLAASVALLVLAALKAA